MFCTATFLILQCYCDTLSKLKIIVKGFNFLFHVDSGNIEIVVSFQPFRATSNIELFVFVVQGVEEQEPSVP